MDIEDREDPREIIANLRKVREPGIVSTIREDVKKDFVCSYCGSSRRANVYFVPEKSSKDEVAIDIECRAFLKTSEKCGHTETRYYPR